jgi:hypothetical protein
MEGQEFLDFAEIVIGPPGSLSLGYLAHGA